MHIQSLGKLHPWTVVLVVLALLFTMLGIGCAARTIKASRLPAEYAAPPVLNLDTLNLSGLTNNSVSVEVLQPGDVLDITMITDYAKLETSTTPVRVGEDGMVIVPLVGQVSVGGLDIKRAEQAINAESIERGIFRHACITVTMKQYRTCKVTVVGAVKKPGTYELPRGSTSLLAALNAAEGLADEADTQIEIRHTDSRQAMVQKLPEASQVAGSPDGAISQVAYQQTMPGVTPPAVFTIDLRAAATGQVQVPELYDGDVVNVDKRRLPPVYVIGLVQKPGECEFPPNQEFRVLDAIAMAGGISNPVCEDVMVIRKVEGVREPVRIAVSIQEAKNGSGNLVLAPGDTVSVEQTPATIAMDTFRTLFRVTIGGSISWF